LWLQLKAKIVKSRASAEKDNNAIYLETVPPDASLKPILVASMVKVRSHASSTPAPARLFSGPSIPIP
jgi:hypothetical protein